MVGPTKPKPRRRRSLLSASDSAEVGGSWPMRRHRLTTGPPADEAPDVGVEGAELLLHGEEGACVAHRRLHLGPVADDASVREQLLHPRRREAGHLGDVEPRRRPCGTRRRRFRIVDQLNPACAPSSTRNSKWVGSSWTGTPHSVSWYATISGSLPAQSQRGDVAVVPSPWRSWCHRRGELRRRDPVEDVTPQRAVLGEARDGRSPRRGRAPCRGAP